MDLYVDMSVTDRCDRGCCHCAFDSRPERMAFLSTEQIGILLEQIKSFGFRYVKLCISGGGEPLMHPDLAKIADMCFDALGKKFDLLIVTSGCLPESEGEKEIIRELARKHARRIKFLLSFNLYNKSFPERLKTTLDLLLRGGSIWTEIKFCFSLQNFRSTYVQLYNTLNDFEIFSGVEVRHIMVDTRDRFFNPDHYLSEIWSSRTMRRLTGLSFQIDCHYILLSRHGKMLLTVSPMSVHQRGRALKLRDQDHWYLPGCKLLFKPPRPATAHLYLNHHGHFLPDCDCATEPGMSLGKLGQISLVEALKLKEGLGSYLAQSLLADKRQFSDWGLCKICTSYKLAYQK